MIDENPLHRRLLTLDAHLDVPVHFGRAGWSFGERHDPATEIAQVDLPRMEDGNLSGGFFVTYTEQTGLDPKGYAEAHAAALRRSGEIDAVLAAFPDRIGLALTAADARRLHTEGRCVAFKSMENGYCLGEDLRAVAEWHARGVRMAGPVHARTNQLADSATDAPRWAGLSPLGLRWVGEMNRLGMVIDASHASDAAFDQMLDRSAAPIVLSHSGARAIHDTQRNIDDDRLRALARRGGVACFATIFLSEMRIGAERRELFRLHSRIFALAPDAQVDLARRWRALDATEPMWEADVDRFIEGLFHVIDVAGIDAVGIGADWDGGGGFPGMDDITVLPAITARLRDRGLSEAELAKLWSGNLLRVLDAADAVAGEA
jgi:membrane dipeptidase